MSTYYIKGEGKKERDNYGNVFTFPHGTLIVQKEKGNYCNAFFLSCGTLGIHVP